MNNNNENTHMFSLFKRPVFIIPLLVIIAAAGAWIFYATRDSEQAFETASVKRRDVTQEVSVTGMVTPTEAAKLGFEQSGRVAWIGADIGDEVVRGQILVGLENGVISAQLEQARAKHAAEKANLQEMLRGTRAEELDVKEAKVAEAEAALGDVRQALLDAFRDAYIKADDAIRNQVDQFFTNPRTNYPDIDFVTQYDSDLEFDRLRVEGTLTNWDTEIGEVTPEDDLLAYSKTTRSYLEEVRSVLALAITAINGASDSVKDAYQSDIQTARANIEGEISDISSAEKSVRAAQAAFVVAERELALAQAGSTEEEITAQRARVADAEAQIAQYRSRLEKTLIRAPFSGTVTKQEAEVGEIVPANTALVSLISAGDFKIEANVPEADITKLTVGDEAEITLDAYGSDVPFFARVSAVDPAETVIEGVPTYKTTFHFTPAPSFSSSEGQAQGAAKKKVRGFTDPDERIRSGMTADIDVQTGFREQVLAIPQRAIEYRNGNKYVRVVASGGTINETEVQTGLRGSDGLIEITAGLNEGDEVVTFTP